MLYTLEYIQTASLSIRLAPGLSQQRCRQDFTQSQRTFCPKITDISNVYKSSVALRELRPLSHKLRCSSLHFTSRRFGRNWLIDRLSGTVTLPQGSHTSLGAADGCCDGKTFPLHGLSMRDCRDSCMRGVPLRDAASTRAGPIWEYNACTRFAVADRMLPVARVAAPLPVLPPRRCHSNGKTCRWMAFGLREYTCVTRSASGKLFVIIRPHVSWLIHTSNHS